MSMFRKSVEEMQVS